MRSLNVELAALMSDAGPEYVSHEAFDFCDEYVVQRILSVRYTPQMNGSAERVFGVHIPRARTMIAESGLTKRAYALAFQYSLWGYNRSYVKSIGCRPVDRLPHPHFEDLHLSRAFGSRVWARQPDVHLEDKMSPVARPGVFVGMSELYKGYIVYYPDTHEFEAAVHCDFDEGSMPLLTHPQDELPHAPLPAVAPLPETPRLEAIRFEPPVFTPEPTDGLPSPPRLLHGSPATEDGTGGRQAERPLDVEPVAMPWEDESTHGLPLCAHAWGRG